MKKSTRKVTLLITNGCNLNCTYCYEHHKGHGMMTCGTALQIMSHELSLAEQSRCKVLHVAFMGGEPFLNFEVIQCVIEWMRNQNTNVRLEASAATNGTLITEEIKSWLVTRKGMLKVQLSYDGNETLQLTNRTSKVIDVDFFLKTFPLQGVHITVSKQTLPYLSEGVRHILDKGAKCSTTLAMGTDWTEQDANVYARELRILSETYLTEYIDREPIPVLTHCFDLTEGKSDVKSSRATYDIDGKVYPCHLFSPVVVGKDRAISMAEFEQDEELKRFGGKNDPYCADCLLRNWCPTCYGFNYLFTGNTGTRDHRICKMVFAQALAASEYQIRYFQKVGITEENAHKAKAAIRAYRILTANKDIELR